MTAAEYIQHITSQGGKARAEKLSAEQLSEIGKKAGLAGGAARAKALSSKRRSEIARKAAEARWQKKRKAAKEEGGDVIR